MNIFLRRLDQGSLVVAGGPVWVDDPARYASDPHAQACAPGRHTVVWSAKVAALGLPRLPIFVDPAPSDSGSGMTLRFCPIWRAGAGFRVAAESMQFWVTGGHRAFATRGRNTWRAFVSPPGASLEPDESKTFELRALEPFPYTVTLRARHVPAKQLVVLSGRVTAAGEAIRRARVNVLVVPNSGPARSVGPAKTNASGQYTLRTRIKETTTYLAQVDPLLRSCTAASTALAGCTSETVSRPEAVAIRVRVQTR